MPIGGFESLPVDQFLADTLQVQLIGGSNHGPHQHLKAARDEQPYAGVLQIGVKEEEAADDEEEARQEVVEDVSPLVDAVEGSFVAVRVSFGCVNDSLENPLFRSLLHRDPLSFVVRCGNPVEVRGRRTELVGSTRLMWWSRRSVKSPYPIYNYSRRP